MAGCKAAQMVLVHGGAADGVQGFGMMPNKFVPMDTGGMHFHSTFRSPGLISGLTFTSGALVEAGVCWES